MRARGSRRSVARVSSRPHTLARDVGKAMPKFSSLGTRNGQAWSAMGRAEAPEGNSTPLESRAGRHTTYTTNIRIGCCALVRGSKRQHAVSRRPRAAPLMQRRGRGARRAPPFSLDQVRRTPSIVGERVNKQRFAPTSESSKRAPWLRSGPGAGRLHSRAPSACSVMHQPPHVCMGDP